MGLKLKTSFQKILPPGLKHLAGRVAAFFGTVFRKIWSRKLLLRKILLYFGHFLLVELIVFPIVAILLIYHGPFTNLKSMIVSTSMGTNKNKYWATAFLSADEIEKILSVTNAKVKDATQDISQIHIPTPAPPAVPTPEPSAVPTAAPSEAPSAAPSAAPSPVSTTHVTVEDISGDYYKGKLMIVPDPSKIALKMAPKFGEIGAPLSEFVKYYHALGGLNAGGFQDDNYQGTGAFPDGVAMQDGKLMYAQKGITYYNVIGLSNDNILVISNGMTLEKIQSSNLRAVVSFGPALIINRQPLVYSSGETLQPRSAIGQTKDGTILLLVIDGRQAASKGANYMDVVNILLKHGAVNAANLDGGSSSTMNYLGKTINNPCDITGERSIASAFLIMP